jgi:hypothetical protein
MKSAPDISIASQCLPSLLKHRFDDDTPVGDGPAEQPACPLPVEDLLDCWSRMDTRNRQLGLERYDYGDIHSHVLMQTVSRLPMASVTGRLLRIPEWCAPVLWRRMLGVRKHVVPSVFFHLGMSYLARKKIGESSCENSAKVIAEQAIAARAPAELFCWSHPYCHHAQALRKSADSPERPASCAHHTARIGQMLIAVGERLDRAELLLAGISASQALLQYHSWQFYDDETCTVSYYPDTRDEIINTAADVVALFLSIPETYLTDQLQSAIDGLLHMIASEQQPDGSWYYCTRRYYHQTGATRFIDGHHTAMVLKTLAIASMAGCLDRRPQELVEKALLAGVDFYVRRLLRPDGRALYFPDSRREAGVVGYTEGISALCACMQSPVFAGLPVRKQLVRLVPAMVTLALKRFLNPRTFDVACCRFLNRPYQIQSARWGSAPLMHAITDFISTFQFTATPSPEMVHGRTVKEAIRR